MRMRRGAGWWLAAAVYVVIAATIIHVYVSPFPIRVNSLLIVKR